MRVAEKMLNKAEELAFRELDSIAQDNALRLFAKPRLSDVILKDSPLSQADFDFYTRAHVDFVVTDDETKPLFIVEYDGPFHAAPVQQRRDRTKDGLCADAGLGILRINANHVTKLYRGMSVLRWIIEVTELEKWFDEAQAAGHVPFDEPFDAAMIMQDGKGRKWPYWLSVSATQSLNAFVFDRQKPTQRGWAGIVGTDAENNLLELSYCWFDDRVIWSKTGVRRQNFQFPAYDLLREISICELELKFVNIKPGSCKRLAERRCSKFADSFAAATTRTPAIPAAARGRSITHGVTLPAGNFPDGKGGTRAVPPPDTGAAERGHQTPLAGRDAARIGAQLQRRDIHHSARGPRLRAEAAGHRRPARGAASLDDTPRRNRIVRFATDSLLEGDGFELPVPGRETVKPSPCTAAHFTTRRERMPSNCCSQRSLPTAPSLSNWTGT
jgi:hypothetical protein